MANSFQPNVPVSFTSCAPMCWLGCHIETKDPTEILSMTAMRPASNTSIGPAMVVAPAVDGRGERRVDVAHRDVHRPVRRHVRVLLRAEAGDVQAAEREHAVATGFGPGVDGGLPTEHRAVELGGLGGVGHADVDP